MRRTGNQRKPRNSSRCWLDIGSPDACRQQAQQLRSCQEDMPRMQKQMYLGPLLQCKPHDQQSLTYKGRQCCDCC